MHGRSKSERIISQNHILFNVKDCGGAVFLFLFLLLLPIRIVKNFISGNSNAALGMASALLRLPEALMKRLLTAHQRRIRDDQILAFINGEE